MTTQANIKPIKQGFHINGDLVFSSVSKLIDKGKEQINLSETECIQINLESVEHIDSAGIALLIDWKRHCLTVNKTCIFKNSSPQAKSLIETYQLNSALLT